jgi:hypothetical protein
VAAGQANTFKRLTMKSTNLGNWPDPIETMKAQTSDVLLSFSMGKDSLAAWLAIREHFERGRVSTVAWETGPFHPRRCVMRGRTRGRAAARNRRGGRRAAGRNAASAY